MEPFAIDARTAFETMLRAIRVGETLSRSQNRRWDSGCQYFDQNGKTCIVGSLFSPEFREKIRGLRTPDSINSCANTLPVGTLFKEGIISVKNLPPKIDQEMFVRGYLAPIQVAYDNCEWFDFLEVFFVHKHQFKLADV